MSTLIPLNNVTETIQGFQLQSSSDMQVALEYIAGLSAFTYSGTIGVSNVNGTLVWQLMINSATSNGSQTALIGDWIILKNNALVSVCKEANFATLYSPAS